MSKCILTVYSKLLWTFLFALLIGCSTTEIPVTNPRIHVISPYGDFVNVGDNLEVSVTGLEPYEYPVIITISDIRGRVITESHLTADSRGRIEQVTLAYDVRFSFFSLPCLRMPGHYSLEMQSRAGITSTHIVVPEEPMGPVAWFRSHTMTHASTDELVVWGSGLLPDEDYLVWLAPDRWTWNDGGLISSMEPGTYTALEFRSDEDGCIEQLPLLPTFNYELSFNGRYDLILDAAPFGIYNAETDGLDAQGLPGLSSDVWLHSMLPSQPPRYHELAARRDMQYVRHFEAGDEIYTWFISDKWIRTQGHATRRYIVEHRDEWISGTELIDLTEGVELGTTQWATRNAGPILTWASAVPGEYDIVLDMDANGIYWEAKDIVDGGPMGPGIIVD